MSQFLLQFEGNLAADPELVFTRSGQQVCRLRVVHNRRRKNTDGQWEDGAPMFVAVSAWGPLAERCAELEKGNTVVVDARDIDPYPFLRQDGDPGAVLQCNANNVSLSMRFTGAKALPKQTPDAADWTFDGQEPAPEPEPEMANAA
ncbi:single-stranded DNA-binding protein [Actinoplanes sp. NPDC026619]|uniref:single-stranded DNA-binding protein n=1 Tax=Actinoplanes sp. NPDC026619 TaxID=3155798 RepID=UPI0033C3E200